MATKRKRTPLTIAEKYDILQLIINGETRKSIAKIYNLSLITVSKIKSDLEEVRVNFEGTSAAASSSRTYLKTSQDIQLENTLYRWYLRNRDKNVRVTGKMISQQAMELKEKLQIKSGFIASARWVENFKNRYHLCEKDIDEHFRITNQAEADIAKSNFEKLLLSEGYSLDNVYNADNTGILWKALPEKTSIFHRERMITSKKKMKEKVTTFLCTNVTGSHMLPILIIGEINHSRRNRNYYSDDLSVMYRANTKGVLDSKIFNEWFDECFLKSIRERQMKTGRREKTLLLLDNAGSSHESGLINTTDELVKIMYFALDVTPLIQPMDHEVIACFKRIYRKNLLKTIMPISDYRTADEVVINHDKLEFRDCCRIMRDAWLNVNKVILENAWNKLLRREDNKSMENIEIIERDIDETLQLLQRLPEYEGCDRVSVICWFESDKRDIDKQVGTTDILADFLQENIGNELSFEEIIE
ncbi:jerky protein homolog-like [Bombus vosnesenskii]|uniref:Jerky protein homolog-like n=1 Tax=Bombus vosnesenskii TaxID=207650 RepID=A0A6J3LQT0_9HYME|nr:jerky protein homolog-like [Bombus vosnesenskii]